MAFKFNKDNLNIKQELKEKKEELCLEEALKTAREEIEILTSQLKPAQESSKKVFKKRFEELESRLNSQYVEYLARVDEVINAYLDIRKKYEEIYEESLLSAELYHEQKLIAEDKIREFDFEKAKALQEIADEKQEVRNKLAQERIQTEKEIEIQKAETKKELDDKWKETQKMIETAIEQLEAEREGFKSEIAELIAKKETIESDITLLSTKKNTTFKNLRKAKKFFNTKRNILVASGLVLVLFFVNLFSYFVFPTKYLTNSINQATNGKVEDMVLTMVCSVNGENNLKANLHTGYSEIRNENYMFFSIDDSANIYEWERYFKGNAAFIKTPYEPQYIFSENYSSDGLYLNNTDISNTKKALVSSFFNNMKYISKESIGEYNDGNVFYNFLRYLKDKIVPNSVVYSFTIDPKNVEMVYGTISNSESYRKFFEEERGIQEKLKLNDNVKQIDNLLKNIFINSGITNIDGKAVINNGKIETVMINFTGLNKASQEISIFVTATFKSGDKETTYDTKDYLMNSMKYSEVYPRIEQNDFSEAESQGEIIENITTVDQLEKEGYEITPTNKNESEMVPTP